MAYPEDDIIIFDNTANFAKLDTPEGALYSNGLYAQLISGFDNLAQGWDAFGIVDNGDGTFSQGPIYDDVAAGGLGSDTLYGESGDDVLYGGTGYYLDLDNTQGTIIDVPTPRPPFNSFGDPLDNHSFDGFQFSDFVTSNYGAPFSRYDYAGDELHGGDGNDTIFGQLGRDTLTGGSGEDSMFGGRHGDLMDGGTEGDDMFGERGLDTMLGGDEASSTFFIGYNSFWGQNDYAWTSLAGDWMSGGRARDLMDGQAGFDTMYGDQCADTMYGGLHYDLMFGGNGHDYMRGDDEQGNDSGDWFNCFRFGIEACEYRIGYSGNGDSMFGGYGDDTMYGGIGDDLMKGNARDDVMYGEEDDDLMEGNRGNDIMSGGDGCDDMSGGTGNDSMEGDAGWDFMKGDAGNDIMNGGTGNDDMLGGTGDDFMTGGDGDDTMEGNEGNDVMSGNDGNDWMYGNDGADDMSGGEGNDIMCGGADNDTMNGGDGDDQVHGEGGNDQLIGGNGNDTINGGADADTMLGGDGDDVIYFEDATVSPFEGGLYEIAVGGDGADTFVYNFQYPGDPIGGPEADPTDHSIGTSGWAYIDDFSTEDTLQLCLNGDISGLECDYGKIDQPNLNDLEVINGQLIDRLFDTTTPGQSPITLHDNGADTWIIFDNTAGDAQDYSDPEDLIDAHILLKGVSGLTSGLGRTFASIDDMIEAGYDVVVRAELPAEAPEGVDSDYNYNGEGGFLDRYYAQFEPCDVECPDPSCRFDDPWDADGGIPS